MVGRMGTVHQRAQHQRLPKQEKGEDYHTYLLVSIRNSEKLFVINKNTAVIMEGIPSLTVSTSQEAG